MNPSEHDADESVVAGRLAALERLKALHALHGSDLTREMAIADVRQLGFLEFWHSDTDVLLRNFDDFVEWYKPEQRQVVKALGELVKQQGHRVDREREEARRRMADELFYSGMRELTVAHASVLLRKRRQLVFKNEYGVEKGRDKWIEEVRSFVTDLLAVPDHQIPKHDSPEWAANIDQWIDDLVALQAVEAEPLNSMSGADFEVHCAEILTRAGWSVVRNGRSGDQGVDLIASKSGLRVAIQCKRYAGSVGNKAVQEVFAGMSYESCHRAAVVSNAPFTASAVSLARTNRVLLLDQQSLPEFGHWIALL